MDTPEGMNVDHFGHDSLDNRKCNLRNVTRSENMQNRIGSRTGSKSGIRGVSWDENNKDWIVNVKGVYYGRFKDIEEAQKLAERKIQENMPYLSS